MKKLLALGTAGALAALICVGSAEAQGFGISVGYGSPGFDDFDAGFGWGAGYRPYSWGGPRYVGSYYAPIAGGYAYDEPATVVTTRRAAAVPAYGYYAEPRTVVSTRRVVRRILVAAPAGPMRRVVAAPAYDDYDAPRTVVSTRRVVMETPAFDDDVVTTGSIGLAPRVVTRRTVAY